MSGVRTNQSKSKCEKSQHGLGKQLLGQQPLSVLEQPQFGSLDSILYMYVILCNNMYYMTQLIDTKIFNEERAYSRIRRDPESVLLLAIGKEACLLAEELFN